MSSPKPVDTGSPGPGPQSVAFMLNLGWLAVCDGSLNRAEAAFLAGLSESSQPLRGTLARILSEIEEIDYPTLAQACHEVGQMSFKVRELLLDSGIRLCLTDGPITTAEAHGLRLLADLCCGGSGGEARLAERYRAIRNRSLPPIGDPSSIDWWRQQEIPREPDHVDDGSSDVKALRRMQDLAALALPALASPTEIRDRFRDLSRIVHPDRLHGQGHLEVVARSFFQHLHEARDRLLKP
jgi:hypothetical protein